MPCWYGYYFKPIAMCTWNLVSFPIIEGDDSLHEPRGQNQLTCFVLLSLACPSIPSLIVASLFWLILGPCLPVCGSGCSLPFAFLLKSSRSLVPSSYFFPQISRATQLRTHSLWKGREGLDDCKRMLVKQG